MARTAISTARSSLSSTRTGLSSGRTAISVYGVPFDLLDLGLTNLWDFRNGYTGANGTYIPAVVGGHGLNTINVNTATAYTAGEYSIDLDGINDYAITTSPINNSSSTFNALSGFAWVKREVINANHQVFSQWQTIGNLRSWQLRLQSTNLMTVYLSSNGALVTQYDTTSAAITDTNWHHVGFTYDGSTTTVTTYVDGTSIANSLVSGSAPSSIFRSSSGFAIGTVGSAFFFNGKIGIVTLFQYVTLTSSQVTQLYNVTRSVMEV